MLGSLVGPIGDSVKDDFLEGSPKPPNPNLEYAVNTELLRDILDELRIRNLTVPCTVEVQYSQASKLLTSPADFANVRFLYSGKPVFAQKLIIQNNTAEQLQIGINEPIMLDSTGAIGNGITSLVTFETFEFSDVWISSLQLRIINNAGGISVAVNADYGSIPADGVISVYAWTHAQADKDQTR